VYAWSVRMGGISEWKGVDLATTVERTDLTPTERGTDLTPGPSPTGRGEFGWSGGRGDSGRAIAQAYHNMPHVFTLAELMGTYRSSIPQFAAGFADLIPSPSPTGRRE
jgi:hypothetical protein